MGLVIFPPSLLQSKTQRTTIQQSFSGALAKRGQRSTMGKKIFREILVLTRNRPYGVRPYVRPPLHVSRGEILHFKYTHVSAVNRIATRTLRDKNNNNEAESFIRLNLMSVLARTTEKELETEIKNKGDQFRLKNNMRIL